MQGLIEQPVRIVKEGRRVGSDGAKGSIKLVKERIVELAFRKEPFLEEFWCLWHDGEECQVQDLHGHSQVDFFSQQVIPFDKNGLIQLVKEIKWVIQPFALPTAHHQTTVGQKSNGW